MTAVISTNESRYILRQMSPKKLVVVFALARGH